MRLLLVLSALALAGCLREEARVDAIAPAGVAATTGHGAVLTTVKDGAPHDERHGPLPFDLPAVWCVRGPDGAMLIARGRALSPLPWWQRFPCDLAVDLWPGQVVIPVVATLSPQPVRKRSADEITAEAKAHGYAR